MNTKKRVLVLTSTFPRWQGDNEPPFVFELCQKLAERFEIVVLAPHTAGAKLTETMGKVEVVRFHYFFPRWEKLAYQGGILANLKRNRWCYFLLPFFFLAQIFALRRILQEQRIDLIHAHWIIPQGLSAAITSIFTRNMPPLLCTSHGGDLLGLNNGLLRWLKRWVIRCSSQLTVVSSTMAEFARSLGAQSERLQTISMGVDTQTLFTPDQGAPRAINEILFVGRLVEKKGCIFLLEAMPEILRQYPDTHLNIVGSGPEQNALQQQSEHLDITHAVTFYGAMNQEKLPALYRRATVFVAPSIITDQGDQEGLGLVLVEALACECPVVASDLPAIRDVVIDGVTGSVSKQRKHADIAMKVCYLFKHPELRTSLGYAGRQYVQKHYNWSKIFGCYADLIDELTFKCR